MSQVARTAPSAAPITPMSRASAPSTPAAQTIQQATPSASGTWKHPKFDEITRRQYATNFDERNVKIILANGAFLLFSVVGPTIVSQVAILRTLVAYVTFFIMLLKHNADAVPTTESRYSPY
jgi:nucleoporin POM34